MSFAVVLLRHHGDVGGVHKGDLQGAGLFLEKSRFQPSLVHGAGGVCDASFIDVGNPSSVAADVNVGFGHAPLVTLARDMLGLDEGHDGVSIESGASLADIKVRSNYGVELSNIICARCS